MWPRRLGASPPTLPLKGSRPEAAATVGLPTRGRARLAPMRLEKVSGE